MAQFIAGLVVGAVVTIGSAIVVANIVWKFAARSALDRGW